jgi:hypothetical protein
LSTAFHAWAVRREAEIVAQGGLRRDANGVVIV